MNALTSIEIGTMTQNGEVLIPKALRDAAGLRPGHQYRILMNEDGQLIVTSVDERVEDGNERVRRMREGLLAVAGKYANGQTTDEYMREVRGDFEP